MGCVKEIGDRDDIAICSCAVRFAADGGCGRGAQAVAGCNDGVLRAWFLETGQPLVTMQRHDAAVSAVEVQWGFDRCISASADGEAKIWDLQEGTRLRTLKIGAGSLHSMNVDWDVGLVGFVGDTGAIELWSLQELRQIARWT